MQKPRVLWERFALNEKGHDFAVGDIHGHFPALERLLARIGFDDARDRLFAVGDLIDRGPASARFMEFLARPWFHAVRGNHEQMMIESAFDPDMLATWEDNGGGWARRFLSPTAIDQQRAVADQLPFAIEVVTRHGLVGLVHAHLPLPTWAVFRQALQAISAVPIDPMRFPGIHRDTPYFHLDYAPWLWEVLYSRATARAVLGGGVTRAEPREVARIPDLQALVIGHTSVFGAPPPSAANIHLIDSGAGYRREGAALTLMDLATYATFSEPAEQG